jgi:tetratricopeptide (TPR) repeat protein
MLGLAEAAAGSISGFFKQRRDLAMVIEAADNDMPAVLKTIEGVDEQVGFAWTWVFSNPFESDPAAYADKIIAEIATAHAGVDAGLRKKGEPGWPPLPASLRDPARPPAARLRSAAAVLRGLAPRVPGSVTVFGLLPSGIGNAPAYAALAAAVIAHEFPLPWCAGIRFLLRDERPAGAMAALQGPRLCRTSMDFSPPALTAALRAESQNPALPADRRANATLIAAGIDQAHGRTDAAAAGLRTVLTHAGATGNAVLAAVAATGLAACLEQLGDVAGAERILTAALEPCLQTTPPPFMVMLNIFQPLVMIAARQGRWLEAEAHLTAIAWLAEILIMPDTHIEALDRRGMAQIRQGRIAQAETSWRHAIRLAEKSETPHAAEPIRARLDDLLRKNERAA